MEFFGEKLVIRLWDSLERGVAGILAPKQARRTADAELDRKRAEMVVESERIVMIATAQKRAEDILAGKADTPSTVLLLEKAGAGSARLEPILLEARVERAQRAEAISKEINVARAVIAAEAALKTESSNPAETLIEQDWLRRWREGASMVSDDDLQKLWGNVLAGESVKPGKYSLRTLDFLRNLSREEARQIEAAFKYIAGSMLFYGDSSEHLSVNDCLMLQDFGLIEGFGLTEFNIEFRSSRPFEFLLEFSGGDNALVVQHEEAAKLLVMDSIARLTRRGREVYSLCKVNSNVDHLRSWGRKIKEEGFTVTLLQKGAKGLGSFSGGNKELL